jgi:GTPase KRas
MEEFKMVVLGGGGVGKSCLTIQFVQSIFVEDYDPTIEDSYRKVVKFDGRDILFEVLDTAYDEYGYMRDVHIRSGHGFLLVYSIASRYSFDEINALRNRILRVKDEDSFPMVLVANKNDLGDQRQISIEEGQELARSFGCPFFEVSAKTNSNVTEAFHQLIREFHKHALMKEVAGKKKECLIM